MKPGRTFSVAVPLAAVVVASACVATAQADVVFQPEPCTITLASGYAAPADGQFRATVPTSAVQCPAGVTFDQATFPYLDAQFITNVGQYGPELKWVGTTVYNPTSNAIETTYALTLFSYGASDGTVTYSAVAPTYVENSYYLSSGGLNYRLVLARPFSVARVAAPAPACAVNLAPEYRYTWNQEGYFIVPDSAVVCDGFTFNSRDYTLSMALDSKLIGQGQLVTTQRQVVNQSTGLFDTVYELHLTSETGAIAPRFAGARREMSVVQRSDQKWIFGRFTQSSSSALVSQKYAVSPAVTQNYKATLSAPVVIKRATSLSVKAKHSGARKIVLTINADRNASFQNTTAPTYRRQVVLPLTPADHAVVKRGSKIIKKVTLSPFGYARVAIKDTPGRNGYSVTMVTTDDNFGKTVTFKG